MTDQPVIDVDVADSLEGRAVAQWAFGYFVQHRVSGTVAGGMACLLALSVMSQFAHEGERGTPATRASKLAAVERAVAQFLTDTDAPPDSKSQNALIDVVCAALNSAETALDNYAQQTDDKPVTEH